jgi:hypothetical protein
MPRCFLLLVAAGLFASPALAGDLTKIDRTIKKEPAYTGKPKYALLVFGPDAADRVWLVQDEKTLYVDRNGNGDLTEAGKKVAAKEEKNRDAAEEGFLFEVGELTLGGKVHKNLSVAFPRLKVFGSVKDNPHVSAALKTDPETTVAIMRVDVDSERLKGDGVGDRLSQTAGFYDPTGVLQFADKAADAPIIHFDGPWQIAIYGEVPTLKLARDNDFVLVVGTPGLGGGTMAMLAYQKTIPDGAYPKVEARFSAAQPGNEPVKQLFELKDRC